jgi:hypothetical protein
MCYNIYMTNPIIDSGGNKRWQNEYGQLHREDGPAIEYADGGKSWWINGEVHRENGPAEDYVSGYRAWSIHGIEHREDGPAIEYGDGRKEWYLQGKQIT